MTWFKVDDNLAFHAKVVQAGNAAMGLWVRAGSWSAQQLTDGFIPDHIVTTIGNRGQAARLVAAGLWVREDDGYRFHQWNEDGRQPTRATVEKERSEARERMRKAREAKRGSVDVRPNIHRTSGDVRVTRPDPSRPDLPTTQEGGVPYVSSEPAPPLYSGRCQRHGDVPEPPKCGACADVRKAGKARPLTLVPADTQKCLIHMTADVANCNGCAADRKAAG